MRARWIVGLALSAGCAATPTSPTPPTSPAVRTAAALELVESWPAETTLDHADVRDAKDVWPAMFAAARTRIDLAEFYLADQPRSALEPSVRALEDAAARGVHVRVLADEKFYGQYPETLDRLAARANVEVRRIDWSTRGVGGGVLHAKYIVVDGAEACLGSQNFDWRALEHILEVGVRFRAPEQVRALAAIFESDWRAAGAPNDPASKATPPPTASLAPPPPESLDGATVTLAASPRDLLPDPARWDLPQLVRLIDDARASVHVEVLTYRVSGHGGEMHDLEDALVRASQRGVEVSLLVSEWALRKDSVTHLQELAAAGERLKASGKPGLSVRFIRIPLHSSGFIPFARVAHAKYMVVDGARAWVGTSNWERDYFYASRNVGLVVAGGALPARLDAFFASIWTSRYVEAIEPGKTYAEPRVAK